MNDRGTEVQARGLVSGIRDSGKDANLETRNPNPISSIRGYKKALFIFLGSLYLALCLCASVVALTLTPNDANQVLASIFDPVTNAIRLNVNSSAGGTHTPNGADQVLTSIFDALNNAIHVELVPGGSWKPSALDRDVHVDGTVYTSLSGAVTGNNGANPNACSTTNGCTIYDELGTELWSTWPLLGSKNYDIRLGHGTVTGSDAGMYYTLVPVIASQDQISGSLFSLLNSNPVDGSQGSVIRACVGNATPCGGHYFVTAPPPSGTPVLTPITGTLTDTISVEIAWVVNLVTAPDAGLTNTTYAAPGISMPGPATSQVLSSQGVTLTAPCASSPCVFNGSGGNPPDFGTFATGQNYALNTYVYGTGAGASHLYRVAQTITSPGSGTVTFNGTPNQEVTDAGTGCPGNSGSHCYYIESGPDANWLPVVGYIVYAALTTGTNGVYIQQPYQGCQSTVTVGPQTVCAVTASYTVGTAGLPATTTSLLGPALADSTHPLTVLGETLSTGTGAPDKEASRFERLTLEGSDQASELGLNLYGEDLAGYFQIHGHAGVTDAHWLFIGPASQSSTMFQVSSNGIPGSSRFGSLRYPFICDARGGGQCVATIFNLAAMAWQTAGGPPPACLYFVGPTFTSGASWHGEKCTDAILTVGVNNGSTATITGNGPSIEVVGASGSNTTTNSFECGLGTSAAVISGLSVSGGTSSFVDDNQYDILNNNSRSLGTYSCGVGIGQHNTFAEGVDDTPTYYRYAKSGSPVTGKLGCVTSSRTVATCGASPTSYIGPIVGLGSTTVYVQTTGEALVQSSNTAVVGDYICTGTTAGSATDNGSTPCAVGTKVGQAVSITVGPGGAASSSEPLVLLSRN